MKKEFKEGMKDGVPIGLGYFAVSFSLGIAARNAGLTPLQGLISSLLINASAGQYALYLFTSTGGAYFELMIITLIANARYFLMSCSLSQKLSSDTPLGHRMIIGFDITDELFGISVSRKGMLNPYYFYGAMVTTIPFWAIGTTIGIMAGNILPLNVVSALSVALYGMFLAVIIPQGKKDKVVAILIIVSFIVSYLASRLDMFKAVSSGTQIIILTVILSAIAAILFPIKEDEEELTNKEGLANEDELINEEETEVDGA